MFGLITLRTVANAVRARRRQRETQRILSGLPADVKKDIGWPAMVERPGAVPVARSRLAGN